MSHFTRKPVFRVCDQVRLKPACSATERLASLEILVLANIGIMLSRQRKTKVLIRLRGCAGRAAPLLFAYGKNRFSHDATHIHLSHLMTKPTKWHVRLAKTQIRMGIRPVCSESSLSAWRKRGSWVTQWGHSKDSDQTEQMPRLISWSESSLGAQSFCWFCHEAAHLQKDHINYTRVYEWHNYCYAKCQPDVHWSEQQWKTSTDQ